MPTAFVTLTRSAGAGAYHQYKTSYIILFRIYGSNINKPSLQIEPQSTIIHSHGKLHRYGLTMEHDVVAARLAELGNPHRLAVYRFLVKNGHEGATVGQVQQAVGLAGSTLSHHLSRMAKVGLIQQNKVGRTIICTPAYAHLRHLIKFLETECCENTPQA